MPDQLTDRARKAAEEIQDYCALSSHDCDHSADIIERHCGERWISVEEQNPPKLKHVLAVCWRKNDWNDKISRMVVVAEYIPERTVLAEDYLDGDADYDDEGWETDENGNAFVPESWYERAWFNSDYSGWLLDAEVTHWMPIPEMPSRKGAAPCP